MGVNRLGKNLLAGAAVAVNENRAVGGGHFADLFKNFQDFRIFADDVAEIEAVEQLPTQGQIFLLQTLVFDRPGDCMRQLVFGEGFGQNPISGVGSILPDPWCHGRKDQARPDHQDRQTPCTPIAYRSRLGLPTQSPH